MQHGVMADLVDGTAAATPLDTEMKTTRDAFDFLVSPIGATRTEKTFEQKKGKGIFRREFFYIESKEIFHGLAAVKPLSADGGGSSLMHEFNSTSEPGLLNTRVRSCHQCGPCKALNIRRCCNSAVCGHLLQKEVRLVSGASATAPTTRSQLAEKSKALAREVKVGDLIAIELEDGMNESFLIARAQSTLYVYDGPNTAYDKDKYWLGALKTGDSLIDVQKLWQTVPGSKTFVETEHCFPAFDTDIRKIAFELEEVAAPATRSASARRFKSFRMCEELMTELSSCVIVASR